MTHTSVTHDSIKGAKTLRLSNAPRFLIVLMGSIGDVVRALPVAQAIKRSYPQSYIGWLVEPKSKSLVENHPYIDKVFLFDRPAGFKGFVSIIKEIRAHKFEVCFDMQRHLKSGLASFFSAIPNRIGFHRKNSKEFNYLFNNNHVVFRGDSEPKIESYLDFLRHIKIEVPSILDFGIRSDRQHHQELASVLDNSAQPIIGVLLGSTWKSKDWPGQGYQQLIKLLLLKTEGTVVLLGDGSKQELGNDLEVELGSNRVINLTAKTSMKELIFVLSSLSCCVGPDSGPGHIAAAHKVPYIALFGPTSPLRVAPYGMQEHVIRSQLGCSPCNRRICPGLNTLCMRLISPELVAQKVFELLKV